MSVREAFVADFSEEQAVAIETAAASHENGVHDERGSDPFRWALAIAIGYQCMEIARYREHHGITVPWRQLRPWIKKHGDLRNHDGDVDYVTLVTGDYNYFVGLRPVR